MKKSKKIITLALSALMMLSSVSYAADAINVTINGKAIEFDVPAQAISGRTMVPMRKIFEELGADVEWIPEINGIIATKGSKIIAMELGKTTISITDIETGETKSLVLDVPPQAIDSRTLVPVRAVSESLDMDVNWIQDTKTVVIASK